MEIKFTVPGPPKGKQRPRICRINGRSVTHTPKQTIEDEQKVRARCVAALDNWHPEFDACLKTSDKHHFNVRKNASGGSPPAVSRAFFEKSIPLEISILALFPIPQHASKKLKKLMLNGDILPTKRPDSDNIIKIILDALNGVCYHDDAQICQLYFGSRACAASGRNSKPDEQEKAQRIANDSEQSDNAFDRAKTGTWRKPTFADCTAFGEVAQRILKEYKPKDEIWIIAKYYSRQHDGKYYKGFIVRDIIFEREITDEASKSKGYRAFENDDLPF